MFVLAENAAIAEIDSGITRQVLGHDPHLMLVRVTLKKGTVSAIHAHPHRQVTYIESGAFQATINGSTRLLHRGDCYFVAPDAPHGVVALEDGALIDVFSPAREEFLNGRPPAVV